MNFSAPADGINTEFGRDSASGISGRLYPSIDSLVNSDSYDDSDNNSVSDFTETLAKSHFKSTKYLYPQKEYVDQLQPEEIRWFYKRETEKKWTAFIGYDSLRIECRFRVQQQNGNEDLTEDEAADLDQILVRGGLYEVDVPRRSCKSVYWAGIDILI